MKKFLWLLLTVILLGSVLWVGRWLYQRWGASTPDPVSTISLSDDTQSLSLADRLAGWFPQTGAPYGLAARTVSAEDFFADSMQNSDLGQLQTEKNQNTAATNSSANDATSENQPHCDQVSCSANGADSTKNTNPNISDQLHARFPFLPLDGSLLSPDDILSADAPTSQNQTTHSDASTGSSDDSSATTPQIGEISPPLSLSGQPSPTPDPSSATDAPSADQSATTSAPSSTASGNSATGEPPAEGTTTASVSELQSLLDQREAEAGGSGDTQPSTGEGANGAGTLGDALSSLGVSPAWATANGISPATPASLSLADWLSRVNPGPQSLPIPEGTDTSLSLADFLSRLSPGPQFQLPNFSPPSSTLTSTAQGSGVFQTATLQEIFLSDSANTLQFDDIANVSLASNASAAPQPGVGMPVEPIARVFVSQAEADTRTQFFFDGSQSAGSGLRYRWQIAACNSAKSRWATPTVKHTYAECPGLKAISLQITDRYGRTDQVEFTVNVTDPA